MNAAPEIRLLPRGHWRPYNITHLKLDGERIPVERLIGEDAPLPEVRPSKRPELYDLDYYGGVRSVTVFRTYCPHCGQQISERTVPMPRGSAGRIAQESKIWARWHGHLSTNPACFRAALAPADAQEGVG